MLGSQGYGSLRGEGGSALWSDYPRGWAISRAIDIEREKEREEEQSAKLLSWLAKLAEDLADSPF